MLNTQINLSKFSKSFKKVNKILARSEKLQEDKNIIDNECDHLRKSETEEDKVDFAIFSAGLYQFKKKNRNFLEGN